MAKQVKGARANKPNDSFGVVNNNNLYRGKYREEVYKDDEEEVENEEQQAQSDPTEEVATQEQTENSNSFLSPEKKESVDFKKRYDDLKKHYDGKLEEWKGEKQLLVDQINAIQNSKAEVQTNDDLNDFKSKYPDVYEAIDKISSSKSESRVHKLEQELSVIKQKEEKLNKEKSYQELLRLQPDFETLKTNDDFVGWLDKQPESISDGIYNNNTDAKWASRVVDLYKADIGPPKKSKAVDKSKDAAMSVSRSTVRDINVSDKNNKKIWKGSDIAKMKPWEFEKFETDIDLARQEGRIDMNS